MGKTILFAALAAILTLSCGAPQESAPPEVARTTRHCSVRGALPDPTCTPGKVGTTDMDVICGSTTTGRRHVTSSTHKQVFAEYGISYPQPEGAYEVDHYVPLELGGSNDISNLWPEAATPKPGFHEKDLVENKLHKLVCAGKMPLEEAQHRIAQDWLTLYQEEVQ